MFRNRCDYRCVGLVAAPRWELRTVELSFVDSLARLLAAGALGAMIGLEREPAGRGAGLHTHAVVALGAAMFTLAGATASATSPSPVSSTRRVWPPKWRPVWGSSVPERSSVTATR
jgi:hypothetical protein